AVPSFWRRVVRVEDRGRGARRAWDMGEASEPPGGRGGSSNLGPSAHALLRTLGGRNGRCLARPSVSLGKAAQESGTIGVRVNAAGVCECAARLRERGAGVCECVARL